MKKPILVISLIAMLFCHLVLKAQDGKEQAKVPKFVVATQFHWSPDIEDFSMDEWKAIEKEFFDKVISKNELILGTDVVIHFFTADNTEITFVRTHASWSDIEAAGKRTGELIEEAWPDEDERKAFFKKKNAYYADRHSDEIYAVAPGAKQMTEKSTEPMVIYIRKSKGAFPDDGSRDEYDSLTKEFNEAVIQKNEFIKAYYPNFHAWGSDRRDFLEVFVVSSLADIQNSFDRRTELIESNWPDETKRKEYFKKMGRYFNGMHSDYIYRNVPELIK